MRKICCAFSLVLTVFFVAPVMAGDMTIVVENIRNDQGNMRIAVCTEQEYLEPTCGIHVLQPAHQGMVTFHLKSVPTGTYAIQAHHDENGNGVIDRSWIGIPEEGIGFSNKDEKIMGRPDFSESSFTISEQPITKEVKIFYYD